MNIFVLDLDPSSAAQNHCDKHVVKMCLEYPQILSSAAHLLGSSFVYRIKPTHLHHPCVLWAASAEENYLWLAALAVQLFNEYSYRYSRIHAWQRRSRRFATNPPRFNRIEATTRPLCMPERYKVGDPVESYRNYYFGAKLGFSNWTRRPVPQWINWRLTSPVGVNA